MRTLLIIFLFAISPLVAANNSVGCGLGLHHQGLLEPLSESSDSPLFASSNSVLGTVSCWHHNQPKLQANGWFLTSPNLFWQNSISTWRELNRNHGQQHHQKIAVEWSFLRLHEVVVGLSAYQQKNELNALLERDVFVHNQVNILFSGESYLVQQKRQQLALWVDLQLLDGIVTDLHFGKNYYQQPLLFTTEINADVPLSFLSQGKLESWKLTASRRPHQLGWQWQWQFAVERGLLQSSNYPTTAQLSSTDFIGITTELGWQWRYRLKAQLDFFWEAGNHVHYLIFNGNAKKELAVAWQQQVDFHTSVGISWRF